MSNIDFYLTDTIDIISTAVDEWNIETQSELNGRAARVEDYNKLIKDRNGKEVIANMHIIAHSSEVLKYESKIRIRTKNGVAYDRPNKEWVILKMGRAAGFSPSHWEIWL